MMRPPYSLRLLKGGGGSGAQWPGGQRSRQLPARPLELVGTSTALGWAGLSCSIPSHRRCNYPIAPRGPATSSSGSGSSSGGGGMGTTPTPAPAHLRISADMAGVAMMASLPTTTLPTPLPAATFRMVCRPPAEWGAGSARARGLAW